MLIKKQNLLYIVIIIIVFFNSNYLLSELLQKAFCNSSDSFETALKIGLKMNKKLQLIAGI